MQFLVVVTQTATYEFALTIAALPITIILLFLAAFIVRRENYAGHACIIVLYFAGMAYFIFKLVRHVRLRQIEVVRASAAQSDHLLGTGDSVAAGYDCDGRRVYAEFQ